MQTDFCTLSAPYGVHRSQSKDLSTATYSASAKTLSELTRQSSMLQISDQSSFRFFFFSFLFLPSNLSFAPYTHKCLLACNPMSSGLDSGQNIEFKALRLCCHRSFWNPRPNVHYIYRVVYTERLVNQCKQIRSFQFLLSWWLSSRSSLPEPLKHCWGFIKKIASHTQVVGLNSSEYQPDIYKKW